MKQILFILNTLFLFLGLSSCTEEVTSENGENTVEEFNPFFTTDTTVFYTLNIRETNSFNDSIIASNGFVNHYSNDSLIYFEFIDKGYYLRLKINPSTEIYQKQIENKMSELYAFSKTEKFWYGIQTFKEKPVQEIYLLKYPNEWEIKVFQRNRF